MQATAPADNNNNNILVVDDDEVIRDIVRELLECAHFHVHEAPNGRAALQIASENNVDAILTDLRMPEMDGIEFVSSLRAMGKKTPVVFYSGFADKESALKALRLGALEFLEKPFRGEDLVGAVRKACEQSPDGLEAKIKRLGLSGTQARILEGVLKGKSNIEVGKIVGLAEPTVKYHVGNLLERFGVRNRTELRQKVWQLES